MKTTKIEEGYIRTDYKNFKSGEIISDCKIRGARIRARAGANTLNMVKQVHKVIVDKHEGK